MSAVPLPIGAAARLAGCSVPSVRYYEEIGLLPAAPRTDGNQRHYDAAAIRRLTFIRRCREFGFTLEQVRDLAGLVDQPSRDCVEVRDVARDRLRDVRDKLAQLQALEASLAAFVDNCNAACAGGPAVDCTILEDLAAPVAAPVGVQVERRRGCCS